MMTSEGIRRKSNDYLAEMEEAGIPQHMHEGLLYYLLYGISPGGFLRAVLENKLAEAIQKADPINIYRLASYAAFLYSSVPATAWGSPEAVAAWIEKGGMTGVKNPSLTAPDGRDPYCIACGASLAYARAEEPEVGINVGKILSCRECGGSDFRDPKTNTVFHLLRDVPTDFNQRY